MVKLITLLLLLTPSVLLAGSSPDNRKPTDPKSVVSLGIPSARPIPIEDIYFTRSVRAPSWSPGGQQIVFTTNMSGRFNLWKVRASGGWPIQLTQADEFQSGSVWSPDGKWIVYQQDRGGNEIYDLYAIPSDGGDAINLTGTEEVREEGAHWSPDGKTLSMIYKPRTGTVYDIALLDWETRRLRKLTHESAPNCSWNPVAWSPDGKTIYANRWEVSYIDADIYAVDATTGKAVNLTPHQGKILYLASSLSPDGKTLLLTSTEKGGYQNVALLDVSSRKLTWVTDTQWEADSGNFSPDGKSFTYTINEDGRTDAFLVDRATLRAGKISLPAGLNTLPGNPTAYAPQGDRLLVGHQSSSEPGDFWVYDLTSRRATQLTFSAIASLRSAQLPASRIVHYKTFDGKIISAFLTMPPNLNRDGSNPALVLPHGGPTGQVVDSWSSFTAALASRGYICIAPNVRGSTGYGIEFQTANFQDLGGGDLKDVMYAVEFLKATGYVNPKKIGITGGSYGGFMTMMAIGKEPGTWAAAVQLFGIINWLTMIDHSDPELAEYIKIFLGNPVQNRQAYEAASPLNYLQNATAPLLVLQGDNDIRVPREEAEQVVDILKKHGKTVGVHYYPNEGHGFAKRENQIDSMRRTLDWFDRYLRNKN
jgi:dipeptidyl aminopeptidase/acylaminoacyl peptidase